MGISIRSENQGAHDPLALPTESLKQVHDFGNIRLIILTTQFWLQPNAADVIWA